MLAVRVGDHEPDAAFACALVASAIRTGGKPAWVFSDRGRQFTSRRFRAALTRRGVKHRYGAVGRPGLPTIDRWWRTLKDEFARGLFLYRPLKSIQRDLEDYLAWYSRHRPHWSLKDHSPDEVFFGKALAAPRRLDRAILKITLHGGDRRFPVFRLATAA